MNIDMNFIPDGKSGIWSIGIFTVSREDEKFGAMRAIFSSSSSGRYVPAGTYKKLCRNGAIVMSNTPDEIRDQMFFIATAKNHVLINGLGLGVTLYLALQKKEVTRVTVI